MNRFTLQGGPNGALMQHDANGAYVRFNDLAPIIDALRSLVNVTGGMLLIDSDKLANENAYRVLTEFETGTPYNAPNPKTQLNDARLRLAVAEHPNAIPKRPFLNPENDDTDWRRRSETRRRLALVLDSAPTTAMGQENRRRQMLHLMAEYLTALPPE